MEPGLGGIKCQMKGGTRVKVMYGSGWGVMQEDPREVVGQVKGRVQLDQNTCLPAPGINLFIYLLKKLKNIFR